MSREAGFGTERVVVRPRSGSSCGARSRPSRKGLTRSLAEEPLLALEPAVAPEVSGPARGSSGCVLRTGATAAGAGEIAPRRVVPADPWTVGRQPPPVCERCGAAFGFGRPPPVPPWPDWPPPAREESAGAAGARGWVHAQRAILGKQQVAAPIVDAPHAGLHPIGRRRPVAGALERLQARPAEALPVHGMLLQLIAPLVDGLLEGVVVRHGAGGGHLHAIGDDIGGVAHAGDLTLEPAVGRECFDDQVRPPLPLAEAALQLGHLHRVLPVARHAPQVGAEPRGGARERARAVGQQGVRHGVLGPRCRRPPGLRVELVRVDVHQQLPRPSEDPVLVPPAPVRRCPVVLEAQVPERLGASWTEDHGAGRKLGRVGPPGARQELGAGGVQQLLRRVQHLCEQAGVLVEGAEVPRIVQVVGAQRLEPRQNREVVVEERLELALELQEGQGVHVPQVLGRVHAQGGNLAHFPDVGDVACLVLLGPEEIALHPALLARQEAVDNAILSRIHVALK
eukprot:7552599-Alexandrium_andersonii.AAC.2